MLLEVLEEFTPDERRLLIKFSCGRMGLPPPGHKWSSQLSINFADTNLPDPVKSLPKAPTCSSSITIPRYQKKELWLQKSPPQYIMDLISNSMGEPILTVWQTLHKICFSFFG
jgi:hypothetical protein